ncbi:DUF2971 domain-containing protein [Marinagarivorans algicola]|uniref:DUF2971 domain-containing protein n=1 Tax=Marinagarivorans algicola TaxID=1513270 RepID=UPI0006B41664|nr:DUF2971 domain-containing protein [Marinagarivorans algicola]
MDWIFYKYSDFEGAKCILTKGTLKFDKPSAFNDPFDCLPANSKVTFDNPELANKLRNQYGREPTLSETMANANNFSRPEYHKINAEDLRVLCLTKNPDNLLMWSHYAGQHKGCCFEFDLRYDFEKSGLNSGDNWVPMAVCYKADRPQLSPFAKGRMKDAILTKSIEWKYEKEWRILRLNNVDSPDNNTVEYPKQFLKCVIIGCNMSPEHKKIIIAAVNKINHDFGVGVKVTQATISEQCYSLNMKDIDLAAHS